MTTLTRTRTEEPRGDYTATYLTVAGPDGAVTLYDVGFVAAVSYCTPTERPGDELSDDCPVRGGQCWGDAYVSAVNQRVADAWRSGGDDAAYEALEELYRQEFES